MAPHSRFVDVLDAELGRARFRAGLQTTPPAPDLGMGLSSGVWQALHEVKTPDLPPRKERGHQGTPAKLTRSADESSSVSVRKASDAPGLPRWSSAQRDALRTFRAFGEFILNDHPSPADVKKAYWRLARQMHPDTCPNPTADTDRAFCELQAAWTELRKGPLPCQTGTFRSLF